MQKMSSCTRADAPPPTRVLAVFIVFFGALPPWLPLTLQSMAFNPQVSFVVIGDAAPPAVLPPNVHFETISYPAIQRRLSLLITPGNESSVRYSFTYKGNDIKPFAAHLFPHLLGAHAWWAWADLDVVFGDLLKFLNFAFTRPACCKVPLRRDGTPKSKRLVNVYHHKEACPCRNGETVNVVSPLYPNPWCKKAWGPFTAFRADVGAELFRRSPQWRAIVASDDYAHFDEWWGPYHYTRGWETMGDVLTRLAEDEGTVVMSKLKMPFAEAKSCRDASCMFCPCGALGLRLHPPSDVAAGAVGARGRAVGRAAPSAGAGRLLVNNKEVMLLHLAEAKYRWLHGDAGAPPLALPAWRPAAAGASGLAAAEAPWRGCVGTSGLGYLNASCGASCSARAPIFHEFDDARAVEKAVKLNRHRVENQWAGHIKYASAADAAPTPHRGRLQFGGCEALQLRSPV